MLSLEEKIGQMLTVGFDGLEAPDYIRDWLSSGSVGNIILFERNVAGPVQLAELTQALHECARHPLLIAIDQEGGAVARLRNSFTESPGAMALGAADSETLAEDVAGVLGREMRALGINWNLAPVVDISQNTENPSVGIRSFGANTQRVSALAAAQVRGFQQAGVAATAKHFPGKGSTPVDAHVALPVIDAPIERLWERDLVPFQAVIQAGIAAIMVTHARYSALEPEFPSTLSPRIMKDLMRGEIHFDGLVTTDCLEMHAVLDHYRPAEAAVLAVGAGADMILVSHTREHQQEARDALLQDARSGRLSEAQIDAAVARISAVKQRFAFSGQTSTRDIRHPAHLIVVREAARAAISTVRAAIDTLPLEPDDTRTIGLVEFAAGRDSEAEDHGNQSHLAARLRQTAPKVQVVVLNADQPSEALATEALLLNERCDLLIVATRNAHLIPAQFDVVQQLLFDANRSILICLRNPFDASVLNGADTILCTCSDSTPSLDAAVEVLMGYLIPTARVPVPVPLDI